MSPRGRSKILDKYPYANRLNFLIGAKNNSEISELTGVNAGTVADYMGGRQRPSAEFLEQLAANGYDVHYILTGNRRPQPDSLIEAAAPSSDSNGKCLEFIAALLAAQRLHGGNPFFEDWCHRNAEELRGMVEHPGLVEKARQIIDESNKGKEGKGAG